MQERSLHTDGERSQRVLHLRTLSTSEVRDLELIKHNGVAFQSYHLKLLFATKFRNVNSSVGWVTFNDAVTFPMEKRKHLQWPVFENVREHFERFMQFQLSFSKHRCEPFLFLDIVDLPASRETGLSIRRCAGKREGTLQCYLERRKSRGDTEPRGPKKRRNPNQRK